MKRLLFIIGITWTTVALQPDHVGPYLATLPSYAALQSKVTCFESTMWNKNTDSFTVCHVFTPIIEEKKDQRKEKEDRS